MAILSKGLQICCNSIKTSLTSSRTRGNPKLHSRTRGNPKIHMEAQKTNDTQSRKSTDCQDTTILDLELCCRAIVTRTAWYWHQIGKQNNRTYQRTQKQTCTGMPTSFLTKVSKTIYLGKKAFLFNKWCQQKWISTCRKIKWNPYLSP